MNLDFDEHASDGAYEQTNPNLTLDGKMVFQGRLSDSPFVESIWYTQSERAGNFTSVAATHWEMVITRMMGRTTMTVRGPETVATPAPIPPDAEFLGITFKLGTFMPIFPASGLVDAPINLPGANSRAFWLNGSAWEFPTFENADTFVARLTRAGLLAREPLVDAALRGQIKVKELSLRTVQRRFAQATGLSHSTVVQIERALRASGLLARGVPILDTVEQAGYADQPHLTRALRRYVGQTPGQILNIRIS
ncbi:MAG TPA: AraC family transcriptional regulator [Phototrophicaceae bacterium]|nr:AraC family transcriptional regulator [Phototrophicaceae bacterium]